VQDQSYFCRQAGPEHEFDALTGHTTHGDASKEVFGVGRSIMQQVKEQVSQLAGHQQTDRVVECVSNEVS